MQSKNSLTERVYENLVERRERVLSGKINCIPWNLPRFELSNPGIERGKYYLLTANSKVGKTQITDFLFLLNIINMIMDGTLDTSVKIFYFSLEMTAEEKMLSCFAHILFVKENIRVSPTDLKSTRSSNPLPQHVLDMIETYKPYFEKIEEIVEFIDDIRTGYGMFSIVRDYMESNGVMHYKELEVTEKDASGKIAKVKRKIRDYYEADDPEEYVLWMVDHISLIQEEFRNGERYNLRESIQLLSADYAIRARNIYGVTPVFVQQQASSQESVENKKANKLKPSMDGLGENKATQRDANLILGLFSPMRHEIEEYMGYDITIFQDNIRFIEILGGREGGAGSIGALFFDGAVNVFRELPRPDDTLALKKVYEKLKQIRNLN